jgi:hypothetical protein
VLKRTRPINNKLPMKSTLLFHKRMTLYVTYVSNQVIFLRLRKVSLVGHYFLYLIGHVLPKALHSYKLCPYN